MKKLFVIALLLTANVYAQRKFEYVKGGIKPRSMVIKAESFSAEDLKNMAVLFCKNYLVPGYGGEVSYEVADDKIIIKSFFKNEFTCNGKPQPLKHVVHLLFRDGRYKIQPVSIRAFGEELVEYDAALKAGKAKNSIPECFYYYNIELFINTIVEYYGNGLLFEGSGENW